MKVFSVGCAIGEDNRIAKRVFVEECEGSHSVVRQRKRWNDTVKDCLKKKKRFRC